MPEKYPFQMISNHFVQFKYTNLENKNDINFFKKLIRISNPIISNNVQYENNHKRTIIEVSNILGEKENIVLIDNKNNPGKIDDIQIVSEPCFKPISIFKWQRCGGNAFDCILNSFKELFQGNELYKAENPMDVFSDKSMRADHSIYTRCDNPEMCPHKCDCFNKQSTIIKNNYYLPVLDKLSIKKYQKDTKLKLVEYIYNHPVKFLYTYANLVLHNTNYIKIFTHKIDNKLRFEKRLEVIKHSEFVFLLKRNFIDVYISYKKAKKINIYTKIDTSNIKIDFNINEYEKQKADYEKYFEEIEKYCNLYKIKYYIIDYDELHGMKEDKILFIKNIIEKQLKIKLTLEKTGIMIKQDTSTDYKDKINNYDVFKQYISNNNININSNYLSRLKKKIIITIDTEAQLIRASNNHVNKLIYGNFKTEENYGILEMMQLANKYNAKLIFFLDIAEIENFGKDIMKKIVNDIYENGHDIQIHFHPDQLPKEWFEKNKMEKRMLDNVCYEDAIKIFNYINEISKEIGIKNIIAFRGGGWRYNKHVLTAMKEFGYKLSFHYNPSTNKQRYNDKYRSIFKHNNEIFEIPLSTYRVDNKHIAFDIIDKNINIENYNEEFMVFVLHSWSLMKLNQDNGYYEPCGKDRYNSLETFFKFIQMNNNKYETIDSNVLFEKIKNNKYNIENIFPTEYHIQFDYQNLEKKDDFKTITKDCNNYNKIIGEPICETDNKKISINLQNDDNKITNIVLVNNKLNGAQISNIQLIEKINPNCQYLGTIKNCNICNNTNFIEFNGSLRKCNICEAIERHRAIKQYSIVHPVTIKNKNCLLIAPGKAEKNIFQDLNCTIKTADIRPGFDIRLDLMNIDIKEERYDIVYANKVFEHVLDDILAFNNIYKILKPNGLLLFTGDITVIPKTIKTKNIHSWYSEDDYTQYKIGTFRKYSVNDLYEILNNIFDNVNVYSTIDSITNSFHYIFKCTK